MTASADSVPSEPLGIDGRAQANIIPSAHGKPQKSRHRASVACASCRDRRTRCVVPAGETECDQCKAAGLDCIINYSDERRKPSSKAHLQSLNDRIAILEGLLKEKGEEPPPAEYQTTTQPRTLGEQERAASQNTETSHNGSLLIQESSPEFVEHDSEVSDGRSPPSTLSNSGKESMVKRLLSTRGHLSFDQLSGRLRYFGPTTNCHIYSELNPSDEANRQVLEQQRRTEKIIRTLSPETHDYLMDLYWQHYNSVLHVVHQAAFYEDLENGRVQFYSGFLHICILAMGYRCADRSRPDMLKIALPAGETTLHREAKYMLDCELERPGGIPSIAALLLLGDLECGVGRDNLGWLYAGMANRLCFDVGLHLDNRNADLSQREIEIRRMTLWACVVYDKYWALFLGRPTSLKSADLDIYNLSVQFERLGACQPAGPAKSLETQIYEALIDLMELAGKVTEFMDPASKSNSSIDHNAYLRCAALDRELGSWYSRLAKPLQWTPENIATAPFSFFLLHQQYHCTLILLHRHFALYDDAKPAQDGGDSSDSNGEPDNHFSSLSRTVCTKHAVRVARIFWQHRQRFDTRLIFVTGLQHAGTAAIALVAALAYIKDRSSRAANMQYLEVLAAAIEDMTVAYQPAERMSTVLKAVMTELRADAPSTATNSRSLIPARRGSSNDQDRPDHSVPYKKRHTATAKASRSGNQSTATSSATISQHDTPVSSNMDMDSTSIADRQGSTQTDKSSHSIDGFVLVTPRTADSTNMTGIWPNLSIKEDPSLDYPMSSYGGQFTFPLSQNLPISNNTFRSAWMGAETPNISRPPSTITDFSRHRLPSLPLSISEEMEEDMTFGGAAGDMGNNVDFMPSMSSNDAEWLRGNEQQVANVLTDLDGFPPLRSEKAPSVFSMPSSSTSFLPSSAAATTTTTMKGVKREGARSQSTNDANSGRAETMGALNDIWNEMLRASRGSG